MIIRQIKIKNFGQYSDFHLTLSGTGLNMIAEANEFGKTTLAEFIRRILFGFPDGRSNLNPYPANDPKNYGGSLTVECGGEVFEIERLNGTLRILRNQAEVTDPTAFLKQYLTVSESFYRNVYAVTIDELNEIKLLDEAEIKSRLYGAGLSLGNLSIDRLQNDLTKRAALLYTPRGQKHQSAQLTREIEEMEQQLRAVTDQIPQYEAAVTTLADGQKQLSNLERQRQALDRELKLKEQQHQCFAAYQKLQAMQQKLQEHGLVENIPAEQWELELAKLKLAIRQNDAQAQTVKEQLAALPADSAVPPEIALREFALQELGNLFFFYERDLQDLAKLQTGEPPQTKLKLLIILLCIAVPLILLGLITHFLVVLLGGALLVPCYLVHIYNQQQREKRQNFNERIAVLVARIREFEKNFAGHFADCAPDRQLIQQALLETLKLKTQAEKTRISRESLLLQQQQLIHDREHQERSIVDFFRQRQCADEKAYQQRIADFAQYRELRRNCETLQKHLTEMYGEPMLSECATLDQAALDRQLDQLLQRQQELAGKAMELTQNFGSANQIIENFRRLPDPTVLRNELEALGNRRRDIFREYMVCTQALRLLELAIAKFEKERQPHVIRQAGDLFEKFTAGRYVNLRKTLDGALNVFDTVKNGDKNPLQLSRGTLDLLMLSLRLALIDYCEESGPSLPVILDDVAVNIDQSRTARLMETLQSFAAKRQVLFFCKK